MRFTLLSIFCFAFLLGAQAQPNYNKLADGVIAQVGDKIILKSDLEKALAQLRSNNIEINDSIRGEMLVQLISTKMMVRQAEIDSLPLQDEEIDNRLDRKIRYFSQMMGGEDKLEKFYGKSVVEIKDEFREQERDGILSEKMQEKVTSSISVSPKEVKAFFAKIPVDSLPLIDAEYEVGEIVMYPEISQEQRKYTIDKLNSIRNDIINGKIRFQTAAKLYSTDGSARNGGELGYFGHGEMVPEFEAVAYKLKPLEISEVVKTAFGYHLIQLIDRKGDRLNVRHILLMPPILQGDYTAAQNRLDSIRELLVTGKITFQEAVKKYSQGENSKGYGGIVRNPNTGAGKLTAAEMGSELFFYVEKLKVGEYSTVISFEEQKKGYRILYLKSKSTQHVLNLSDDYTRVQNAALAEKKQNEMQAWFYKNRKSCYLRVDPEFTQLPAVAKLLNAGK